MAQPTSDTKALDSQVVSNTANANGSTDANGSTVSSTVVNAATAALNTVTLGASKAAEVATSAVSGVTGTFKAQEPDAPMPEETDEQVEEQIDPNHIYYHAETEDEPVTPVVESSKPKEFLTPSAPANGADYSANTAKSSASLGQVSDHQALDDSAGQESTQKAKDKSARIAKLKFADVKINESDLDEGLQVCHTALNLFLNSRMIEAERLLEEHADKRLYHALGLSVISVIKGFMTFEPQDLAVAISHCKDSLVIAQLLRKPSSAIGNLGRFVRGTGQSPQTMHGMTKVQRHAELVYAESLLLKAITGIVYSGDIFAFVSEALNMRNAYGIFRSLDKYLDWADQKHMQGTGLAHDPTIDADFRSGVYLGNGLIGVILGLLPSKLLKIMDVFGYGGNTMVGLDILSQAGKWSPDPKRTKPEIEKKDEGVRRAVCDMSILLYHLVLSTFLPVPYVNITYADKILHYHLERYPQGIFFLYFSGRLYSTQGLNERAIQQFTAARDVQKEYVQLRHICVWDMSLCNLSLGHWQEAQAQFDVLLKESNWSKAVYNYAVGATRWQSGDESAETNAVICKTTSLMQRIAGKSIPLEKFASRKSKKFKLQNRLLVPAMELGYVFHTFSNASRKSLLEVHLPEISKALGHLTETDPSAYEGGAQAHLEDLCLAHFLRGVILRFIAQPEPHAKVTPANSPIPKAEAEEQALLSLQTVLSNGSKIMLDHWLIYFAHYEIGRLYAGSGQIEKAKEQFNLVLSGKILEDKVRKGKYSLQNMCLLRSNGVLRTLEGN
ncbi:unnamed protein product [Tilletia controversa]|uniref:Tetratricopeptide repeat protein 39B n=3 Tax=Tilletia TaxID=13289 RepID=A0A8X7SZF8_9BASI|nr:hypothetical protein CF336_g835 [Tilletia laevis]KAE8204087.1 hypothetical protein CF328_g1285 [Tilletia controversa]KAE8264556.1 hypothetical protein A4X03_0g859 [Tilletia caries]KAE8207992.1 hypothetical protein CF335_g741 [Tilletia laevis]KAE8253044.1 hypothetical protein A4X06_0g1746 [Tilletia controversa]